MINVNVVSNILAAIDSLLCDCFLMKKKTQTHTTFDFWLSSVSGCFHLKFMTLCISLFIVNCIVVIRPYKGTTSGQFRCWNFNQNPRTNVLSLGVASTGLMNLLPAKFHNHLKAVKCSIPNNHHTPKALHFVLRDIKPKSEVKKNNRNNNLI